MTFSKIYIYLLTVLIGSSYAFTNNILNPEPVETHFSHHEVYELRTYTTHEGKLDDLHERFANHTMTLFEKHGMKNISYWTPMDRENTLIYIISHESREAAEKSWDGFRNDPEWQKAYEDSRKDGPIVEKVESVFMKKTDYSPM